MNDKISILNDIDRVIMAAESAIDALETWQTTSDGFDRIRMRRHLVSAAKKSYEKLRKILDDSKYCSCKAKDSDLEHSAPDSCYCHVGNAPCGWCTNPDNDPDKSEGAE